MDSEWGGVCLDQHDRVKKLRNCFNNNSVEGGTESTTLPELEALRLGNLNFLHMKEAG
jgi:hypothetical protein